VSAFLRVTSVDGVVMQCVERSQKEISAQDEKENGVAWELSSGGEKNRDSEGVSLRNDQGAAVQGISARRVEAPVSQQEWALCSVDRG
jgi:hypothetical protein